MWIFMALLGVVLLGIGIFQWAQSGAGLWRILDIRRAKRGLPKKQREESAEERQLGQMADRSLRASFRILGFLALFLWVFLAASMLLDFLGVDLLGTLSSRAQRYWTAYPTPPGGRSQTTPERNNILLHMAQGVRK